MTNESEQTQTQTEVKRFEVKTELKVLKALDRLLTESTNNLNESEAIAKDSVSVMSENSILMVTAKSQEAKISILRFTDRTQTEAKINLTYEAKPNQSYYNAEVLSDILKLFTLFESSLTLKIGTDYPLTAENEHFKVILACKLETD